MDADERLMSAGPDQNDAYTIENGDLAADRVGRARSRGGNELGKLNCGPDCVNRQSFIHCDPRTCPAGAQCANRCNAAIAESKLWL